MYLEIISPSGIVFSQEVNSVTLQNEQGKFQVLDNHANLLSSLAIASIKINYDNHDDYYTCNSGVIEVHKNKVNILTESSEHYKDIDTNRASQAKGRAVERLKDKSNKDIDIDRAKLALHKALNRLKLSTLK